MTTLHELAYCHSVENSDHVAITYDDGGGRRNVMTYGELYKASEKFADVLRTHNVEQEVIGVCVLMSEDIPAILLGILQIPAAFYVFEPKSVGNLAQTLKKLRVGIVVVSVICLKHLEPMLRSLGEKRHQVFASYGVVIIKLTNIVREKNDNNLAYCIRTSGTTDAPKLVRVPHSCIVPNIKYLRDLYEVTPDDALFLASPLTFDPSVIDLFLTLSCGASLLITSGRIKIQPRELSKMLHEYHITILQVTPSLMLSFGAPLLKNTILSDTSHLRVLAMGGERFPPLQVVKTWKAHGNETKLYNLYGLTEVSCWSTCYEVTEEDLRENYEIPIGLPMYDTTLVVLDEKDQIVTGGFGWLYTGGIQRACQIDDTPTSSEMLNTGDWVKVDQYGQIFYLQRKDDQFKRFGKRINLLEIDAVILKEYTSFIDNCKAAIYNGRLILFYKLSERKAVLHKPALEARMVDKLTEMLPPYYKPDYLVEVDSIPLTHHGKQNIPSLIENLKWNVRQPDSLESFFVDCWRISLNLPEDAIINPSANFVNEGGDSLMAVHFIDQLELNLGITLTSLIQYIFHNSFVETLYQLNVLIGEHKRAGGKANKKKKSSTASATVTAATAAAVAAAVATTPSADATATASAVATFAPVASTSAATTFDHAFDIATTSVATIFDAAVYAAAATFGAPTTSAAATTYAAAATTYAAAAAATTFGAPITSAVATATTFGAPTTSAAATTYAAVATTYAAAAAATTFGAPITSAVATATTFGAPTTSAAATTYAAAAAATTFGAPTTSAAATTYAAVATTYAAAAAAATTFGAPITSAVATATTFGAPTTSAAATTYAAAAAATTFGAPITSAAAGLAGTSAASELGKRSMLTNEVQVPPKVFRKQFTELESLLAKPHITCKHKNKIFTLLWEYNTEKCVDATPVLYPDNMGGGILFIGSHSHRFYALSIKTGRLLWQVLLGDRIESTACLSLCKKYVIVGCYDTYVYTMSVSTGEIYWKFKTDGIIKCSPTLDPWTSHIWIGSYDHCIYSLNLETKTYTIKRDLQDSNIFSSPVICLDPHQAYICTLGGHLYTLDPYNGKTRWRQKFNKPIFSTPCLFNKGIAVACVDGSLYTFTHEGVQMWNFFTGGEIFSSPLSLLLEQEIIVFASFSRFIYCCLINGDLVWKTNVDSRPYATPCSNVTNDVELSDRLFIVLCTTDGHIKILCSKCGVVIKLFKLPGEIFSSPVVYGNKILVGCRDNKVYCFNIQDSGTFPDS